VKRRTVSLVERSWEQYAPDGLNSMQKDREQGSGVRDQKRNELRRGRRFDLRNAGVDRKTLPHPSLLSGEGWDRTSPIFAAPPEQQKSTVFLSESRPAATGRRTCGCSCLCLSSQVPWSLSPCLSTPYSLLLRSRRASVSHGDFPPSGGDGGSAG
jgi:hypothetical protein